jgi:ketosteroid isomerase-like protein
MSISHTTNHSNSEAEIRELFANDDGIVVFDAVPPFVHRGADTTSRKQQWLAAYRTGIGHEIRDLEITARDDLAFCHFLVRISGTMVDGTEVAMWVRATSCLRKRDDGWKIVHEHASVPFDAETGKAVVISQL